MALFTIDEDLWRNFDRFDIDLTGLFTLIIDLFIYSLMVYPWIFFIREIQQSSPLFEPRWMSIDRPLMIEWFVQSEVISLPILLPPSIKPKKKFLRTRIIFYVDGSYSRSMEVGHAGFRCSDGNRRFILSHPICIRRGSTEIEVRAACLALLYAKQKKYSSILIYTDNSKVKQLLTRPKSIDRRRYPFFFRTLKKYHNELNNVQIDVQQICGHPTAEEQRQSLHKTEFARTDRWIRRVNRTFIQRYWIHFMALNIAMSDTY